MADNVTHEDPRAVEANRIAAALRDPGDHIRRLDDASIAWCEARLHSHFTTLSWATSPLPRLSLTRVEYTSSLGDAIARFDREWGSAETRPFRYLPWSHVHRVSRWMSELGHARSRDLRHAGRYTQPIREQLLAAFHYTTDSLVAVHLATLEDNVSDDGSDNGSGNVSPARPLASLLARGVYALALPDSAMLLYLPSAAEPVHHSSDPIERDFVDALAADDRIGLVYGDYLEERGELGRADAIRARSGPTIGAPVHYIFENARPLLLFRARAQPTPHALVPDASVPAARLEIAGHVHALGSRTGIAQRDGQFVVDPEPGASAAVLTQAGGTLWISIARDYASAAVNHSTLFDRTRQPLFDGDVITLQGCAATVRL